ncbi:MAG: radical SAM protein [Dehalococcoidia bacterium]
MSIIYGPVPSWRLGRSLGIDMVSTHAKTCSFDCVYCQLGATVSRQSERKEFVSLNSLRQELNHLPQIKADFVTFSGVGEPTLAKNLGAAIEIARRTLHIPIAVLTNSSLMHEPGVCKDLARADVVVAKLDAPDDNLLHLVNRPVFRLTVDQITEGIRSFRSIFAGKLAIQIMFINTNRQKAPELAELVRGFSADEVQVNTPLRPCPVKPLNPNDLDKIKRHFLEFKNVFTVYEASKPAVTPMDPQQTERRRPEAQQI